MSQAPGLVISAPASGSGKTLVTLGLLRAWGRSGRTVASFKVGPDFIDPAFHQAASGRTAWNLDPWGMRRATLAQLLGRAAAGADLVLGEGVMGLFDGARASQGSTAELAETLGYPVLLIVDASAQAASAAAVVHGFATFRPTLSLAGVVFNRVGSERHADILRSACEPVGVPVVGCIPRQPELVVPERHLGLVQACEHPDLEAFIERAADTMERHVDLDTLAALASPAKLELPAPVPPLPAPGRRIAVARDLAFQFAYPALLEGWRQAGAELSFFSPLAGEAPSSSADAVYLPGGYPELYAEQLAAAKAWREGLRGLADRGACIYGECGGYMALGESLTDASGHAHRMAGLLPLETSFESRRLHLGYRAVYTRGASFLGSPGTRLRGHEFHYARATREGSAEPLFTVSDANGRELGSVGLRKGSVSGSYVHLIDLE